MLTVRLLTYTMEVMALNNTLKTFTFRSTYYFYFSPSAKISTVMESPRFFSME